MPNASFPPRRMRFSLESRCRIVQLVLSGESPPAAAAACGASRATGYRLWRRYRTGGWPALCDRPSTPVRQPRRLAPEAEQEILAWREQTGYGPLRLAVILERPASTIGKVLRRLGCSRQPVAGWSRLEASVHRLGQSREPGDHWLDALAEACPPQLAALGIECSSLGRAGVDVQPHPCHRLGHGQTLPSSGVSRSPSPAS